MRTTQTRMWYLYGAAALLALWQAIAALAAVPIIPGPLAVLATLGQTFTDRIAVHALYSLWRIVAGVFWAILLGGPLGLAMGYFPKLDRALSPVVYLTYPIPKIALLPIIMLLCGLGELSKIMMIGLIVIFQVIIAVRDGVRSIPAELYYPVYSLGADFFAILREILIPATLPKVLTSLRIAMATGISVLFFTETFGSEYGMGFYIMDAWMRVNYLEMYSGIVVLSVIGLALFGLIDFWENKFCRWRLN